MLFIIKIYKYKLKSFIIYYRLKLFTHLSAYSIVEVLTT